jgi:osmotically-inducible protein OsmY
MSHVLVSDLQDRAQQALAASPVYALRELRVEHSGDTLVLSGQVSSFYHKQLAQEVVRSIAEDGAAAVINAIKVC